MLDLDGMRYIIVCFQPLRPLSPIPPLLPPSASPSPSPFLSLRDLSLPLASPTLLPPSQPFICENVTCVRPLSLTQNTEGIYLNTLVQPGWRY